MNCKNYGFSFSGKTFQRSPVFYNGDGRDNDGGSDDDNGGDDDGFSLPTMLS